MSPSPRLTAFQLGTMAVACGLSVANLYYNQPLLAAMARTFHATVREAGTLSMLTQLGYALGMLCLVPLGDLRERRALVATMLIAVAIALGLAAVAPTLWWLSGASLLVGLTTVAPQLLIPFAAHLAEPQERGRVVGFLMGGLLIGVLLARTFSGLLGAHFGWRAVYWVAAGLMLVVAAVLYRVLPQSRTGMVASYGELMRSIWPMVRREPVLREAAVIGAMLFGAFSAFWTTLIFRLEAAPFHAGSEVAGLFGLVGVVGALAAPLAGRFADVRGPRLMVGVGIAVTGLAFAAFWAGGATWLGLVAGVILLDLGVQLAQVSNQTRIYGLPKEAHSRMNTVYMFTYFLGGASGSTLAALAWSAWQWTGVCALALGYVVLAGLAFQGWFTNRPRRIWPSSER